MKSRMLFKITSFFLMQIMLFGNIAIAADCFDCTSKNMVLRLQANHLSPRLHIENSTLSGLFVKGMPDPAPKEEIKQSLLEKLTAYAIRKEEENKDKGFFGQNIVSLMLKKRVQKIKKRAESFKIKNKQRKIAVQDIKKLRNLLNAKKSMMKTEMSEQFEQRINQLERLLDEVETYGDWEDLLALGSQLNKELYQYKALAKELSSLLGQAKPNNKSPRIKKRMRKKFVRPKEHNIKSSVIIEPQISQPEEQDDDVPEENTAISEPDIPANDILDKKIPEALEKTDRTMFIASARKPVLEKAMEKLIDAYNLDQDELPPETALKFKRQIEILKEDIESMGKGQFSALKHALRELENNFLQVVLLHKNNREQAKAKEKLMRAQRKNTAKQPAAKTIPQSSGTENKPFKKKDPFTQAVTLCQQEKIQLCSVDNVTTALRGQIELLEQVIDAKLKNTTELRHYNTTRMTDGLLVQLAYSETLDKIISNSHIIMELQGDHYELKCVKILNAGSKMLLRPVKNNGVFASDFPSDLRRAKFFYIPSTYSEDVQKKTLKKIISQLKGQDKSTGVKVLDYLLRIKAAVGDIENIEEFEESLAYTTDLDIFQKAAANLIVKTKFGLILGPFGTGKTRSLLAGAKNIILRNKKPVFIVAPQHKIANDITLLAGGCNIPVLRCGNKTDKFTSEIEEKYGRDSEIAQAEFIRKYKNLNTKDQDNGCLFVGTDLGASFDWLVKELRDPKSAVFFKDVTLIVDEAALINYPELITAVYMLRPDALILVGDHVQFSPYKLASQLPQKIMELFKKKITRKTMWRYHQSSFKELIPLPFNKVKLLMNYRNPWISVDFLQKWYQGILTLGSISKKRGDIIDEDTFLIEDTALWKKQYHDEFYMGTNSYCNKTEALWILKRIKCFLEKGYSADDLAIITCYDGQIRLISDFIDADGDISPEDAQILKDNTFTPIRFQGSEKKVILTSLVRSREFNEFSDNNYNGKKIDALFESEPEFAKAEALLVLLSRHKGKVSVIGNSQTLDSLTKRKYTKINMLYSSLFKYKDRIRACLEAQNVELDKGRSEFEQRCDFLQYSI